MRRKAPRKRADAPAAQPEFKVNPFAGLRLPPEAAPSSPPPPRRPAPRQPAGPDRLDPADRELLNAFRDAPSLVFETRGPAVRLGLVRRARGRTLTTVHGLPAVSLQDLMEATEALRAELGLTARVRENVLEIEGDVRDRLRPWLAGRGCSVQDAGAGAAGAADGRGTAAGDHTEHGTPRPGPGTQ